MEQYSDEYWTGVVRKEFIENSLIWRPTLYLGLDTRDSKQDSSGLLNEAHSWVNRICSYSNQHGIIDATVSHEHEDHVHVHAAILLSNPKRGIVRLAKSLWHSGFAHVALYDDTKGGIIYNNIGHRPTGMIGNIATRDIYVHCPRKSGSCRRNKCRYHRGLVNLYK